MDFCAFSENGKYFSLISPDGRLKVWDAETNTLKQEYTPDLHLSAPPTCLRWISLGGGGGSTRRKRKSLQLNVSNLKDVKNNYIALGTAAGKILLYSVEQAKIDSILSDERSFEARDTNITCIDWSAERGLYSCSSDSTLREWNISENGTRQTYKLNVDDKNSYNSKITAIKLVPNTENADIASRLLLIGCCRIKLYSLDSNSVLRDFTGHSTDITHLSVVNFSKSGKLFAVSACKNERIISLWNLSESNSTSAKSKQKRKAHQTTAFCSFLLEDVPKNIVSTAEDAEVTSLILAAVTRTGSLHYYSHILNGTSAVKAIKPNVTVQVATDEARPMPALCCHLTSDLRDSITLAYLSSQAAQSVTFEKITPDLSSKSQVLVRPSTDCSKRAKAKSDASKTRHDNVDDDTRQERVTYVDGGGTNKTSNKRNASGKKIEVPMESRLANLSLEKGGAGEASQQNMGQLLVQGLHSNDKKLLLSVLQCTDATIAYNSVSRLPPRYLNPLLHHITEMLTRKTSQAKAACVWLSAMMRAHASLLLATANTEPTAERIAGVLSALAVKRSSLSALLSLKGRLALTLGQLEERTVDTIEEDNAMLEYRDSSDSESLDQDALGPIKRVASDDENSWDEDGATEDQNDASHQSDSEMNEDE